MNINFKQIVAGLAFAAGAGAAQATLVLPGSETPLQSVINGLYTAAGTPTSAAPDVNGGQSANDQIWSIEGSGTAAATFIIEIAGNAASNNFGIYGLGTNNQVQLFGGAASNADRATVMLFGDGSLEVKYTDVGGPNSTTVNYAAGTFTSNLFGFYLGTTGGTYYSEESRNAGGADQMVAFQGDGDKIKLPGAFPGVWGSSSYILAWEDLPYGNSDKDFNDLVVYVESIKPMPVSEPGTLALLGGGLLGIAGVARRRARR